MEAPLGALAGYWDLRAEPRVKIYEAVVLTLHLVVAECLRACKTHSWALLCPHP